MTTLEPVLGSNYIDGRYKAILNSTCAARALNSLIRAQQQFGNGFFMSCQQLKRELLGDYCKDTLTKALRQLEGIPGFIRWIGTSGRLLRVSKYTIDLEAISKWLRDHNQADHIHGLEVARKRPAVSIKPHAGEAPPVVANLEGVHPMVATSATWAFLLEQFPTKVSVDFAEWLLAKIRERGMQTLDAFMACMKKTLARGPVNDPLAYLVSCYQAGSNIQRVADAVTPSKEVLTTPKELVAGAWWVLGGQTYEVLEVGPVFVLLENEFQVKDFLLKEVLKGHLKQ